jgi:hypothetical protein
VPLDARRCQRDASQPIAPIRLQRSTTHINTITTTTHQYHHNNKQQQQQQQQQTTNKRHTNRSANISDQFARAWPFGDRCRCVRQCRCRRAMSVGGRCCCESCTCVSMLLLLLLLLLLLVVRTMERGRVICTERCNNAAVDQTLDNAQFTTKRSHLPTNKKSTTTTTTTTTTTNNESYGS